MSFHCILCGYSGTFLDDRGRPHARCPACFSLDRHRYQWYVVQRKGLLEQAKPGPFLHFAAERWLAPLLRGIGSYVSTDINRSRKPPPDVIADACKLPFSDNRFTLAWASHLLEHIVECGIALAEIYRVLTPGGTAVLDVPVFGRRTVRLQSPDDYGHVWRPGYDWFKRYKAAGFQVKLYASHNAPAYYAFPKEAIVALCTKKP
jgi:hypothetical protein